MSWYKDRDFPEVKVSNADIIAVIKNPKQLERVIQEYNALEEKLNSSLLVAQDLVQAKNQLAEQLAAEQAYSTKLMTALKKVETVTITDGCDECSRLWEREYELGTVKEAIALPRPGEHTP